MVFSSPIYCWVVISNIISINTFLVLEWMTALQRSSKTCVKNQFFYIFIPSPDDMASFSRGDRVRVTIPDEIHPNHERFHRVRDIVLLSPKTTPVGLLVTSAIRFSLVLNSKTVAWKTFAGATCVHRDDLWIPRQWRPTSPTSKDNFRRATNR